ncbi:hypothetical protein LguiA_031585 [Lonicera macranthoides]
MGIPDRSLIDLIDKVKSWLSWGSSDQTCLPPEFTMSYTGSEFCYDCEVDLAESSLIYHCQRCGRVICQKCLQGCDMKSCKFCSDLNIAHEGGKKYSDKIHPFESPRQSPEPPSSSSSGAIVDGSSLHDVTRSGGPTPVSIRRSPNRSDEDEGEDSENHFLSPYSNDTSDVDSSSVSARNYSFKSVGSSPSDSPSRIHITCNRVGHSVQQQKVEIPNGGHLDQETMAVLKRPGTGTEDQDNTYDKPLDFENDGLIWFPPPPDDEDDEADNNFFAYDDEDDEVGESSAVFSSSNNLNSIYPQEKKQDDDFKEPLISVVHGHFRALVSQLLNGEGFEAGSEKGMETWLDIVTAIAWQAANFVKPDTRKGGSMDPGDYVKIKCIASGHPSESKLVKGVVCTKNIKHKRMTSQYKTPRLLVLGGALEYQRVPNQLASFDKLLQQEIDHLKMIVSKIEAHRPNVLLVEKSVSSYAQEYLLAKEISLVLNVKRSILERISRCTGAPITPSIDKISTTWVGHCELFRLEKVSEEHEAANQFNKKPSKTLMYFEGCPRRLGCTVVLKGSCREELKKIKHVVQYAVFAAYHLSLETSFLADEGASLPKMTVKPSITVPERTTANNPISIAPTSITPTTYPQVEDPLKFDELLVENHNPHHNSPPTLNRARTIFTDALDDDLPTLMAMEESPETLSQKKRQTGRAPSEYYSSTDSQQSILVSFSSRCVLTGTICERSRLLRIKFYGCFDKPLGRYLRDDLFDRTSCCRSCKEPSEVHVICYTHQQGNLTINVRRLNSIKLPGEQDGKIWMWHRCLRCTHIDGIPPATRRVVMSDAAWGLSFGKFLELSFSNHATANRVASCGHSLQKDCLRYYGFGSMVAFFRYSPIEILSVRLPPSMLELHDQVQHDWSRKEAAELLRKTEALYGEISSVLDSIEKKLTSFGHEMSNASELQNHIIEFKQLIIEEINNYTDVLQPAGEENPELGQSAVDILELNHMRHSLLISSHIWDRRLYSLDSLLKRFSSCKVASDTEPKERISDEETYADGVPKISSFDPRVNEESTSCKHRKAENTNDDGVVAVTANLSEKIDSAWTGTDRHPSKVQLLDRPEAASLVQTNQIINPPLRKLMLPTRVYSFDSALRIQERIRKGLPPSSLYLSTLKSFHASGDYRNMVRDPVSKRMNSLISPTEGQNLNLLLRTPPSFVSSTSLLPEGAHLLLQENGRNNVVIAVYDNEPTSIISFALTSKEHEDCISDKLSGSEGENSAASNFSTWQSFGSLDLDYVHYGNYGYEDASTTTSAPFMDSKSSPHLKISFEDESSSAGGKVKFSVTCYFAREFDALRKKYCPRKMDFVRSLSRCSRWSAQGGKSNVYFAKSFDERFIIKQVTKTELESFEEFAPEYFKYLTDSLNSGSPTCLAKVLGIYQVTVKNLKGGKETKMDLMVMENLFFGRNISRVYDLKGSARSRYNSDTTGTNKVLLDMNLLEALRTKPIFLGSKAKRSLERAVWNDTSFLASADVMDYSLLVGVDEEKKELVLGIIDFMRQYTWDKHLETWVKASGILGGPKNASPTIISPKQYKRRFRKAMTTYFLTVPDQWSS